MKKLILLIFLSLLLPAKDIFGQGIADGSRYFYIQESMSPFIKYTYIDTLKIRSSSADTVYFSCFGQDTPDFVKIGDKIHYISNIIPYTNLEYDYSLQAGDTFTYLDTMPFISGRTQMYVVDSVKSLMLEDSNTYKHWYLRNIENDFPFKPKAIWVENLGEKTMGWSWFYAGIEDGPTRLKAICSKNQDLIYWNNYIVDLDRSCDFDSLAKLVSLSESSSRQITLYPNPANDYIRFDTDTTVQFALLNAFGQKVMSGCSDGYISVGHLPEGIYYIRIQRDQEIYGTKFVKR